MRHSVLLSLSILFLLIGAIINVSADTQVDEFDYQGQWDHSSLLTGQQGIASDDNGTFFISDGSPTSDDGDFSIVVAKLGADNSFVPSSINGISGLDVPYHASDPFCDDTFLFVPWSNWPTQSQAKCYVYYLSNLTEVSGSPFDLKDSGGSYLPGVSSGCWWNGSYYFSTYADGSPETISHVHIFTFDTSSGFSYVENHSLGKDMVQGIEVYRDTLYFIRCHAGEDDNVWGISRSTWDTGALTYENLASDSGNPNGPYEGMTFDTSDNICQAFFGFGGDVFEEFNYTSYVPPENGYNISSSIPFGVSLPINYTATPTPPHHDSDMEYFGMSIPISYSADDNSSGFVIQDSNIPYLTIAGLAVFFPILGLLIYKEKRR